MANKTSRSPGTKTRKPNDEVRMSFVATEALRKRFHTRMAALGVAQGDFLRECIGALLSEKITGMNLGIQISVKVPKAR